MTRPSDSSPRAAWRPFDIDANDPHGELVDRSGLTREAITGIDELMAALVELRRTEEELREASEAYMQLNSTDMRALHYLIAAAHRGEQPTAAALGSELRISSASTTKLLDRLERGGHVHRRAHPSDRRAITIEVAPATRQAAMETMGRQQAGRFRAAAVVVDMRDPVLPWLARARRQGATVFASRGFDPSGTWGREHLAEVGSCDVWMLNEQEACGFARLNDPLAAARWLSTHAPLVVVTRGARGMLAVDAAAGVEAEATAEGGSENAEAPRDEAAALTEDLKRVSAEYANYRRRVDRERQSAVEGAKASVLSGLLEIADELGLAAQHGDLEEGSPLRKFNDKFLAVLAAQGVEVDMPNLPREITLPGTDPAPWRLRISAQDASTIRLLLAPEGDAALERPAGALGIVTNEDTVPLDASIDEHRIVVETPTMRVEVMREPFSLRVEDAQVLSRAQLRWHVRGAEGADADLRIDLLMDPRREARIQALDTTAPARTA